MKQSVALFAGIVLLSLYCQANADTQINLQYNNTFINSKTADILVDYLELKLGSYSIEGWVRLSLTTLTTCPSSFFFNENAFIFGVSNTISRWESFDITTKTFLSAKTQAWSIGAGFIANYDSKQKEASLYSPKPISDLFGRWYFLYIAYHAQLNQIFFALKDSFSSSYSVMWSSNTIVRNPFQQRIFRFIVGSESSFQMNGFVNDAKLTYLPSSQYYQNTDDIDRNMKTTPFKYSIQFSKQEYKFTQIYEFPPKQQIIKVISGETVHGADEYGINLSFVLDNTIVPSTGKDILLFRLSTNEPNLQGTDQSEGDRALYAYLEKGTKFCFTTYSIKLPVNNIYMTSCFLNAKVQAGEISLYQGYSRKLQRVLCFLKIGVDKVYGSYIENVIHVDPYQFYAVFGNDKPTGPWQGKYKNIAAEIGIGSYQETLFNSYPTLSSLNKPFNLTQFPQPGPSTIAPIPIPLSPPTPIRTQLSSEIQSQFQKSEFFYFDPFNKKPILTRLVDPNYSKKSPIVQYSMHLWYKRSLVEPFFSNLYGVRDYLQSIAGVTEKTSFVNLEQEALSVTYRPHQSGPQPAYIFTTYNGTSSSISKAVEYSNCQDQGEWHWIYIAYDNKIKQAVITVQLGNQPFRINIISEVYHTTSGSLTAYFGGIGTLSVPGIIFDPQFLYYDGCYLNNIVNTQLYYDANVSNPNFIGSISKQIWSFSESLQKAKENKATRFVISTGRITATDYSIQIWAIWYPYTKNVGKESVLALVSMKDPKELPIDPKLAQLGDYVMKISVNAVGIVFTTYNYGYTNSSDSTLLSQTIPISDIDLFNEWCFYYFGYSQKLSTVKGFVNCYSKFIGSVSFPNITHILANNLYFSLEGTITQDHWYGNYYNPILTNHDILRTDYKFNEDRPLLRNGQLSFSQCGYINQIVEASEKKDQFSFSEVKSVHIPKGSSIELYKKTNSKGLYAKFLSPVECLKNKKNEDHFDQWNQLASLFHEDKILFFDEEGQTLSQHQAKALFLGKSYLRKQSQLQQKVLLNEE